MGMRRIVRATPFIPGTYSVYVIGEDEQEYFQEVISNPHKYDEWYGMSILETEYGAPLITESDEVLTVG